LKTKLIYMKRRLLSRLVLMITEFEGLGQVSVYIPLNLIFLIFPLDQIPYF